MAGFYPGSEHPEEAVRKLRNLLGTGVSCIINLMEEDELNYYGSRFVSYQPFAAEIGSHLGLRVRCRRFPIQDFSIPTVTRMFEILEAIDEAIASGQVVYVHCLGGIGRTGTVVGCYLLRHGLAAADTVLQRIAELRNRTPGLYPRSPETEEQRRFVCEWALIDGPGHAIG